MNRSLTITDQILQTAIINLELANLANVSASSVRYSWDQIPAQYTSSHNFKPSDLTVTTPTNILWFDTGVTGGAIVENGTIVNITTGILPVYPFSVTDTSLIMAKNSQFTFSVPSGTFSESVGWTLVFSMKDVGYDGWDQGGRIFSMTPAGVDDDHLSGGGNLHINATALPSGGTIVNTVAVNFFSNSVSIPTGLTVGDFQSNVNTIVMRFDPANAGRLSTLNCATGIITEVPADLDASFNPTLFTVGGIRVGTEKSSFETPADFQFWNFPLSDSAMQDVRLAYCQRYDSGLSTEATDGDHLVYNGLDWAPKTISDPIQTNMVWSFDIGYGAFEPSRGFLIDDLSSSWSGTTKIKIVKTDNGNTDQTNALVFQVDTNAMLKFRLVNDLEEAYHVFLVTATDSFVDPVYTLSVIYQPDQSFGSDIAIASTDWSLRSYESAIVSTSVRKTISTVDPGVNDDSSQGISIGDLWVNTTSDSIFGSANDTVGAAVWKLLG